MQAVAGQIKKCHTRGHFTEEGNKNEEIEMTMSVSSGQKGLRCRITLSIYVEISPTIIRVDEEEKKGKFLQLFEYLTMTCACAKRERESERSKSWCKTKQYDRKAIIVNSLISKSHLHAFPKGEKLRRTYII
jgi:hypothetical protein